MEPRRPHIIFYSFLACLLVIFHKTDAAFTHKPETEGEITFVLNDMQGAKKFNGENIMEVLAQMAEFLKSLE